MGHAHGLAVLSVAMLSVVACAATGLPTPRPPLPPLTCQGPTLELTEGQPGGLLLTLSLPSSPATLTGCPDHVERLILARRDGDGPLERLYVFEAGDPASTALFEEGSIQFMDNQMVDGHTFTYVAYVEPRGPRRDRAAAPRSIVWRGPPPPPSGLRASGLGRHVYIEWEPVDGRGAVVFRRRLGGEGYVRVSQVLDAGQGAFVDGDVSPGVVYGYVVSGVEFSGDLPILGEPTAEVYVEAMPAGALPGTGPPPTGP